MIRHFSCATLAILMPGLAMAEPYLSDATYCGETIAAAHEDGVMALYPTGWETIEYGCEWDEEIRFDWAQTTTQIRPGYCAEPGEYIYPGVFVFGMSEFEPGVILMWSSSNETGEATRFFTCD